MLLAGIYHATSGRGGAAAAAEGLDWWRVLATTSAPVVGINSGRTKPRFYDSSSARMNQHIGGNSKSAVRSNEQLYHQAHDGELKRSSTQQQVSRGRRRHHSDKSYDYSRKHHHPDYEVERPSAQKVSRGLVQHHSSDMAQDRARKCRQYTSERVMGAKQNSFPASRNEARARGSSSRRQGKHLQQSSTRVLINEDTVRQQRPDRSGGRRSTFDPKQGGSQRMQRPTSSTHSHPSREMRKRGTPIVNDGTETTRPRPTMTKQQQHNSMASLSCGLGKGSAHFSSKDKRRDRLSGMSSAQYVLA
jgi:hypothetical protein